MAVGGGRSALSIDGLSVLVVGQVASPESMMRERDMEGWGESFDALYDLVTPEFCHIERLRNESLTSAALRLSSRMEEYQRICGRILKPPLGCIPLFSYIFQGYDFLRMQRQVFVPIYSFIRLFVHSFNKYFLSAPSYQEFQH